LFVKVRNSANYTDVMPGDRSVNPPDPAPGIPQPPKGRS
jgi:hypothetical protein